MRVSLAEMTRSRNGDAGDECISRRDEWEMSVSLAEMAHPRSDGSGRDTRWTKLVFFSVYGCFTFGGAVENLVISRIFWVISLIPDLLDM